MAASDRLGLLDKARIIAPPTYNRWLVPPAALAIHLCIGMAYGFSVFWLPLSRAVGVDHSATTCPGDADRFFGKAPFTRSLFDRRDSTQFDLGWMYTLFFVLLGVSAAIWGGWLEQVGPRRAGVVSALCWCGGLMISAVGVYLHQLWMMWLGSGIIGGIGLGLGYISPVSTLIKWFPDRRGMATGMAIMGFGGGAMIGSPLATILMNHYAHADLGRRVGDLRHARARSISCSCSRGAFGYRLPPPGWKPEGWTPPANTKAMITDWPRAPEGGAQDPAILADLGGALPQRLGRHRHYRRRRADVAGDFRRRAVRRCRRSASPISPTTRRPKAALVGAAFVGLFSLFNIAGRIFWASLSDKIGRKITYFIFFALGFALLRRRPRRSRTLGTLAPVRRRPSA